MKSIFLYSLLLVSLVGCAVMNAPVRNARDLSSYKSFYVQAQSNDSLSLAPIIAERLQKAGVNCTSGSAAKPTAPADALVRYRYDLLPANPSHLQKLILEVVDLRSGKTASLSQSSQPASLMPDSNTDMVTKSVNNLLAATPGPSGHARGSLMERDTLLW